MKMQPGKLNISIDGQFGSTGKGVLNSYLVTIAGNQFDYAISNAAPNAGHTFDLGDGKGKQTCFHLPVAGVINKSSHIHLCAGSIIDPELLSKEIKQFRVDGRLSIHPRACILLPEHMDEEQDANSGPTKLASTQKGVGAALADKVRRKPGLRTASEYYTSNEIKEIDLSVELDEGKTAFMEVPQGFDLSINHGLSYPHCTSRDITVASALNDAGLHPKYLGKVYMSVRSFPIRVGHIYDNEGTIIGHSGPFYSDSDEKQWTELGLNPELTTVTQRIRRVATFSGKQYKRALRMLQPDVVFVNFLNYFKNEASFREMATRMELMHDQVWGPDGQRPRFLLGYGPSVMEVATSMDEFRNAMIEKGAWTYDVDDPSTKRSFDFLGLHGAQT